MHFLGKSRSTLGTAHIRRSNDEFLEIKTRHIRSKDIGTIDMVNRNVKEPLYLVGVEVNGDDTVGTRTLNHIGNQFGTDRDAGFVLAVLTRPTEIRNDGNHLVGTGTLGGINHKEQLHKVVAAGAGGLYEINRMSADGLVEISGELTIGETVDMYIA